MTTYTETFNKADSSTLGPVLTWTEASGTNYANCGVVSNSFAINTFPAGPTAYGFARPSVNVGSVGMYTQAVVAAASTVPTTHTVVEFWLGLCLGTETPGGSTQNGYHGIWVRFIHSATPGVAIYYIGGSDHVTFLSQDITGESDLLVGDVLRADYDPAAGLIRGLVNGVVIHSHQLVADDLADANFPALGQRGGLGISVNKVAGPTVNVDRLDSFEVGVVGGISLGTVLPIPFWVGNDRYETIALAYEGSTTSNAPPEFRHFYAGPQLWEETLAGDASLPAWHALDENGTYPYGELELPFREFNDGREVTIDGIRVEFTPIPDTVDSTIDSATTVGFTARVEGYGIPDPANVTPIGLLSSDAQSYSSTVGDSTLNTYTVPSADRIPAEWPNTQSVWLPLRLPQKVRAARVILTDVHLLEINSITLLGQFVPSRTV